ncbi:MULTISPECIES: hypothetical protein [unclassified Massilia]|uniref:hypothetical protein n=1 Tax=unclassified Massilia TaxID=2609279 RepID=UPI001592EB3D|nr:MULTISPECIES: hypothetical protein [unclassified Massilia]NVD98793.1 hypothetical protein [Massilia sp. BJB1822]
MNGQPRTCEQILVDCLEKALMALGQSAAMNFLGPLWYVDEEQREAPPASDATLNDTHHTGTAS